MSEDNKGGLQIRGESGFGKDGKEGCLTMKRENHSEVTETEACEKEIQRRAPFQSVVESKSYSLVASFILFCKTLLMRSLAS